METSNGKSDKTINVMPCKNNGSVLPSPQPYAPRSLSAENGALAAAFRSAFMTFGVTEDLWGVARCTADEKRILNDIFAMHLKSKAQEAVTEAPQAPSVAPGDRARCHGCAQYLRSLIECEDCGQAWFHSEECRSQFYDRHLPICDANRVGGDAYAFYNVTARTSVIAQELLEPLGLDIPAPLPPTQPDGYVILFHSAAQVN